MRKRAQIRALLLLHLKQEGTLSRLALPPFPEFILAGLPTGLQKSAAPGERIRAQIDACGIAAKIE